MGYPTKYQGHQIDEALEKGRNLRVVNNGWIKLEASSSSPINLGSLKNPGNYTTSHWTDGPDLGSMIVAPLNITVTSISGVLYQFAEVAGEKYFRSITSDKNVYGSWGIDKVTGAINPGPTAPANPTNDATIWLDTSDASTPILKIYSNDKWVEIVPAGAMKSSIYDPKGKQVDIFQYIDDTIAEASLGAIVIDYNAHINNSDIHVTQAEKDKWNSAATPDTVTSAMNTLKPSIDNKIADTVSESVSEVEALTAETIKLQSTVDEHINNESIHPSIEKQAEWSAKANSEHNHYLDGTVTIRPSNIIGSIPSTMIPYDVKERVYEVSSLNEMYALTKNPVHNGDVICVTVDGSSDWFFVINDEYLGTNDAQKAFKQFSGGSIVDVSWESISGTPTTLAGYGITDAVSKTDIAAIQTQITTLESELPDEIDLTGTADAQTIYNNAIDNLAIIEAAISAMEASVSKLEYMSM